MTLATASGSPIIAGSRLAIGGEGEVYAVTSPPSFVFKKYLLRTLAGDLTLERRLEVMVSRPPAEWREPRSGHVMLAWPSEVVLEDGRFAGFLMPAVDMADTVELHRVTNPSDRRAAGGAGSWARGFTWKYLVRTAANLAHATHALHERGVVIGDFNERNVRVTRDARVTLLDCDSMQVTDPVSGERFFCWVGRPEYTPPELVNADWKTTVRHPSSDLFALAIHIYQLLVEGEHPFRGIWSGPGDKPPVIELARQGQWVLKAGGPLKPRPSAVEITLLPDAILGMFRAAFEDGAANPSARPTAHDWEQVLTRLADDVTRCNQDPSHDYWAGLQRCPWCAHAAREWGHRLTADVFPPARRWEPPPGWSAEGAPSPGTEALPKGQQGLQRRIELGASRLRITHRDIETVPKLYNAMADGDEWDFCLLRVTPTFHDGTKYRFAEAYVWVRLETPGQSWPDDRRPIAWWMEPGSVVRKVHHSRNIQVSPNGPYVGGNVGLGSDYEEDEPFILAYGTQCPAAYWKFMKTRGRAIRGSHELTMVVRMPKGCHTQALIEMNGTVFKRRLGVLPTRSDAGSCNVVLPPRAIREAKIDLGGPEE
jgi:DNA-binding helix-hairpin-helix protein with protein kinase domain